MHIDLSQHTKQVDYPFIGYITHTWTWSIPFLLSQRIASCDGKATAYPNWDALKCTGTPMGCNGDVYAHPGYSIQIVYDTTNSLYSCLRTIRLELGAAAFIPFTNTCRDFLPNGLGQYATTGAHIGDNCSINPFLETYSNLDFSCVDSNVPNQSYTFDLGVFDMVLSS